MEQEIYSGLFSALIYLNLKPYRALPYLVMWVSWLAQNSALFEENKVPSFTTSTQVMGLLSYYKDNLGQKSIREVGSQRIDKSRS